MKYKKEIAFYDGITSTENLPFPIVNYPGFYGAFFVFQKAKNSELFFCECSRIPIKNYIKYQLIYNTNNSSSDERNFILDSMYFPLKLVKELISKKTPSNEQVIEKLSFKENLCHECNIIVPEFRYCHEMYGSIFKQTFGWYINKKALEYGVMPISSIILDDICPNHIMENIKIQPEEFKIFYKKNHKNLYESEENTNYYKNYYKQFDTIWKVIENEVRLKFGHKIIGAKGRSSELILYQIIKSIFPNYTITRNYRPKFLKGLEIDVFIHDMNIGIEYQGMQHFQPVKHWGGKIGFEKLLKRDKIKKRLCKKNKVQLFHFNYDEGLNEENIKKRLNIIL